MREQVRARDGSFAGDLHRGGLAGRLYSDDNLREALERMQEREQRALGAHGRRRGTTQISVVDERGNAASLTVSTGSGSGVIVPGTGIHLNNMLGEYDLDPPGRQARAGGAADEHDGAVDRARRRAPAARRRQRGLDPAARRDPPDRRQRRPSRAARRGGDRGAAHPLRRRRRSTAKAAPTRPSSDRLEARGYDLVRWRRRNLYFGGAAAVERRATAASPQPATRGEAATASSSA